MFGCQVSTSRGAAAGNSCLIHPQRQSSHSEKVLQIDYSDMLRICRRQHCTFGNKHNRIAECNFLTQPPRARNKKQSQNVAGPRRLVKPLQQNRSRHIGNEICQESPSHFRVLGSPTLFNRTGTLLPDSAGALPSIRVYFLH